MGLIRIVGTKIGTNNSWSRAPLGAHQPLWLACCCWDSDVDSSGHNMVVCITQLFNGKGHFGKGTDVDPLHIKRSRHIQWYMSGCISRRFHQPSTLSLRSFYSELSGIQCRYAIFGKYAIRPICFRPHPRSSFMLRYVIATPVS